ncbi:MAG: T9SS type A sorting domain-containing protein [Saprospiraceae bacterium]|nr:T9SS type A sorting domain-containing protein [Saprospiraceae bacterium]
MSILMDANATLTVDNSRLFACDGLWNGIVMGDFTTVRTQNNTQIEDAEAAIQSVDKAYTFLEIENTTFNRDRIGIRLENSGVSPHSPVVFTFRENTFECDAPLNGTADEITNVGVQIKNVYSAFLDNPNSTDNIFRNIQNGITAEGKSTDLNIYGYEFLDIRRNGIDFKGRRLMVDGSIFDSVLRNGIFFHEASEARLTNNEFYVRGIDPGVLPGQVHMVDIVSPIPGNSISIGAGNYFYTEGLLDQVVLGISIFSDGISEVNASISNCTFEFFNFSPPQDPATAESNAIFIFGNFPENSDIDIEHNFINTNSLALVTNRGIFVDIGEKNNIHIIGNDFTGSGTHMRFRGVGGIGNEVTSNEHFQSSDFGTGLFVRDFQNLSVCSNTNHAASNVSYLFNGANNGMTFSGNVTFGGAQHSLWVAGDDPVIDQQIHAGNEWFPGLRPAGGGLFFVDHPFLNHVGTDEAQMNLSKFFVHTQQSILNQNGQYDFFSEFHPADIVPDDFPLEDAFVEFETGTPNVACVVQLTGPVNESDKAIADGIYGNLISSPAIAWDGERHLYQKLMSNPGYESAYSGFSTFLQANANSNIGKFHQVRQKIYEAAALPSDLEAQLDGAKGEIEDLDGQINSALSDGSLTEAMLIQYFENRHSQSQEIDNAFGQYATFRSAKLAEAETLIQGINPANAHEGYRKTVYGVFIQAQLYQDGAYTTDQTDRLKEIAMRCSGEAGMVTYVAQGLLSDCERAEIQDFIDACDPELEVEPRSSKSYGSENLGGTPEEGFFFYPNPGRGQLVLSNQKGMVGKAEVFTSTGQLLLTRPVSKGEGFMELGLSSGVYLLKVTFEDGEAVSDKLIINR